MPNIIITAAKEAHPKYRNIPDDELTLRYAKEFPEYLEVDDFKADYDRITRKPVPVVATPKERAGAIESIGRRASGGLQGGLGGPLWKGVELGARLLGADDLAQYSKEVSAEAREYDRQQRLKSANTGVAGFLGDVAGAAPSLLPILPAIAAAPLVGLAQRTAAGIAFGATGGLSTFSDAEKAYYDKYKSEGMSDSEAESAARKSAAIPSIASGIATGTITRFMPVGGVESVTGLFGKGAAASAAGKAAGAEAGKRAVAAGLTEAGVAASIKSGVARQVGLAEARALVATSIPKAFIKGATNEAIEEGIDQIAQSAIQKLSYDPELTLKQAIDNVINSAMVGGALGGSIQAAVQPSARKGAEAAIRQDKIYNELRVQAEAEAKSDATRREDRLEDEMRREKELKALDRTAAENLEAAHAAQQKQRDAQALADKTLIDTLNEKERVEAEAKLTASQQSAVTAIRDLAGKTVGAKITDVTPEGYGPKEPPAATGATAQKMGGLTHAETVLDSELGTRKIEVKDGDTVVGYIAFGNDLNGYDTINMVWVKPDYRGKGISTELYRKALASAKERGRKGLASVDANLHTPEKTKSTRKNFIVRESTDRADTKRALELSGKAHDSVHFIEGEQASRATPAATGATGQHPKLAGLNWARENIPWGERGTTTPELRHKIATALRDAGFRNRVEAEEMSLGEKPFPTREKFEQSVDGNLTLDAMQLLSKVESELRDVGLNPREATLPKREDFKTAEEFWKAAYDIEGKMRATGASAFAGLVRTGQVAGFTKPATPAATGAAQKPEIYETRIRGEDGSVSIRFAVQKEGRKPGERGGGDLLFRTQSEAEKYVAEHVQGVLKRNKIKAEADAAARAELLRPRTSIELFTQGMSPMASKRARNALDNSVSADGMPYRRSELVEKDVQDGAVVITGKDGRRRLQRPSGAYRTDSQLSKTAMDYAEFLVREKRKAEISGTDPLPIPAPAETGAKTEPAYISPEELMARQPKAIPSETVARIEAEEKAYQAQADIKAVTDRILIMIGRKVLPKNVKVVYQPESNFAAYYQSGEIIINAARIVNVEAVLVEEALHAVWADPELQAAWDTVKKTVTIQDIDEQRLRAAADKRYPDNAELREEAAVAKLVRHRTPAIKGFLMAIRKAIAKAFGFHVKLSDIELIQNAAMSKLTTDSKAVQISPPAAPAAKVGTKTRQVEITISDISGFGNKDKTKKVSGSLVKLDADPANEYVAFKFSNSFWKVVEKSTGLSPGETYGKTKAEAISKANANILRAGGSKKMSEIIGSSKKLNESPPAETGAAGQKPSEPTPANPTASKFKPIGVGRKVVSVTSRPDTSTWQVTSFADEYREQPSGHEGYKTLGEALKDVEYVGPENKQTVALGWHSMDAYFEASKQNPGATKANPDNFIYASPRRPLSGLRVPDAVQSLSYKTKTGGMAGVVEVSRTLTLDEMVSFELAPINLAASDAYWKSVADAVHPGHENIRAGKESSSPIPAAEAKPTPAATGATAVEPSKSLRREFKADKNGSTLLLTKSSKPQYAGMVKVTEIYPDGTPGGDRIFKTEEDAIRSIQGESVPDGHRHPESWPVGGKAWKEVTKQKPPAATEAAQKVAVEPAIGVGKVLEIPASSTKAERKAFENIQRDIALIKDYGPKEMQRESRARRKSIERADISMRRAAEVLGLELPRRSTFYNPESDLANANKLEAELRDLFGKTQPTPAATGAAAKTGKPWVDTLHRGVREKASRTDSGDYGSNATYWSGDESRATAYSKPVIGTTGKAGSVIKSEVSLGNPLVFKTTEDARAFRKSIVGPDLLDKPQSQVAADLIEKAIREKGHDGVVVYDSNSNYTAHPDRPFEVVVYDKPTPPDAPRYAAAERDASDQPAFYSRLNRAVEQTTQNKASGAQWKATIKNSKLGTNADEYALVGVGDLEDGKTYTKQEVLDYLRANEVVVKDVTLGGKKEPIAGDTEKASRRHELLSLFESQGDLTDEQSQELDDLNTWLEKRRSTISERTKFETHQLPGAVEGSYRERLLMVPSKPQPAEIQYVAGLARPWRIYAKGEKVHASSYETESEARASLERYPEFSGVNWRDGHELYSSFANPIVRGRTNERLIPIESLRESNPDVYARVKADGRTHALMVFVEENQLPLGTRWHEVNGVKFEGGGSFERASAYAKEHGGTVEKKYSGELAKMPELFRDNGYAIGLKYGLRYAVERNADLYGWTTGEQQAARYNLSKQVKSVTWNEGNKEFSAVPISDGDTISRSGVEAVDLSGIVGKDVAQKLIEATANRFGNRRLEGLDLKIGGEGLKKLYDVEFRNIINNLPAVKKSGQKVGTTAIRSEYKRTFDGREITAEAFKNRVNEVATAWEERRSPEAWERWNVALDRQAESVAKAMDEGQPYSVAMQEHGSNGLLLALGLDGRLGDDLIASNIHSLAITPAIRDAVMGGQARFAASERGAGSELGALQGGVDGVDYLNWADRFRTNFITKYAPITKMERVLRESAGMGRAEFGMERWFERLAGVAGIAKASIIEMRMELDPLVAGDEKAFNNYIFWQYIERRSTLRAQALADVASARAMVANGTATDADRASIARNNKLADQMEFARYDNPTVAKKNLDSIRANLAKSGALEDMDKAVAIYVKHTNLALDNIVDSGYLAQDRIDKYRNQFPVYIPIINLQIPDSKNGYQVTMGRVGISDPNFKSKNPLAAFDEYIFRMHAKAEVNKAKRRIHKLVVEAARPDIARVEYDRLSSTESGFSLRVNGVDTMVVAHPEVVAAVNSFSDTASNTLNDFLRKANSVLKFGATSASLAFQVRNLLMGDLPALALMSKAGITNPINAVTFVIDVITSFAHNFRASAYGEYSPLMLEFMKSGAMGSSMHSSIDSLGRDTQTGASSEGKISQYIIDAFGKMSNTIEQTSKLAGFKRLMDKAGVATLAELNDPIKQMALVAEVRNYCGSPDFARNGSVMGLAMIRLGFVFVNPAMAGNASALERLTANLNKNSSDSDKKAALTAQIRLGFTVGLATMISYALRSQDDEAEESYDGLDKKSKEDNFHLVTDKYDVDIEGNKVRRFVKIPKRGVIKIVANTMEAYLDYSRAKDPEDFTRMMGRVLEEVIPLDIKGDTLEERIQGTMASVNPAIRVPIEYATGMSFYARQPTVPRSMRGAANSEQYRERTNENIKTLAGVFGVSPLKFKQALESATGGLTRTLLPEKESELSVDSPINIPLVKGYFSPTYRESEDKEYISELRKEADTATVVRTRAAVAFMKSMEGKTIKETYQAAAAKYARTQPELFDRIDDLIDQKMSGATIEDRHITSLPNAQRAKIVMARLQKLPVGERREAVKVLYRKKVISDATAYEMLKAGYNFRQ